MEFDQLRKKAFSLPLKPGVYIMKSAKSEVIYVGKAKALRNRVSSYFINTRKSVKVAAMVAHVDDFDFIITNSELEALMLENSLIKRHQPHYNILLKDDKGYPFIRVDLTQPYPRFEIAMKKLEDNARYFGPYGGRTVAYEVINTLRDTFCLPDCSRRFPRDIGKQRPCINYQMKRCVGVCAGMPPEEYRRLIEEAVCLLCGKSEHLVRSLQAEMEQAAENLQFEQAARLRDRIQALRRLKEKQKVVSGDFPDTDVVAIHSTGARSCAAVLHYMDGTLMSKDVTMLDGIEDADLSEAMESFVQQYYRGRPIIPAEVALSCEIENAELLMQWLSEAAGRKVTVRTPKRGDKYALVRMAMENARDEAQRAETAKERMTYLGTALQKALGLDTPPRRIEAYDMSHTDGGDTVGAMVVFEQFKPRKSEYRKFKIRQDTAGDDCLAMAETLQRRFQRLLNADPGFSQMPDLLLIDGGTAQVQAVAAVIRPMGITCPIRGMVKDDRHRTRAAVDEAGRELSIASEPAVFTFVGTVQEEVHRFVIRYHRTLRDGKVTGSSLDAIPRIGVTRRKLLLRHFRTISAVREATFEELSAVLPSDAALSVYEYFHDETNEESEL